MLEYKRPIVILVSVVAVIAAGLYMYQNPRPSSQVSPKGQATVTAEEPQKTDYGTVAPSDFPTDIPVERGASVEQSYSLNYAGQKQLTIVFPSTKTVKENFDLYTSFLKKNEWKIANPYESAGVSSLYGTKGNDDMNVTISENAATTSVKSQVSISVLKKI